jgi:hypothetical protein
MEEWLHDSNNKDEVNSSRGEVSKVLTSLQKFFPRSEHTNGFRLPKILGMTKMQLYIQHFGSGMNFYGGPGEAAHKTFVKSAGQQNTKESRQICSTNCTPILQLYDVNACYTASSLCIKLSHAIWNR